MAATGSTFCINANTAKCGHCEPGTSPCGPTHQDALYMENGFGAHKYAISNTYDAIGRRTHMSGPYIMSGCGKFGWQPCTTMFTYTGGAGELTRVIDGKKDTTNFVYDNASRLDYITFNSGIQDNLTYDGASQLTARYVNGWINDAMRYDAAGRVLYADQSGQNTLNVNNYYGALGAVVGSVGATQTYYGAAATEKFNTDALGNRFWTKGIGIREPTHPDVDPERTYTIGSNGGLSYVQRLNPPLGFAYWKSLSYDQSGNLDIVAEYEAQSGTYTYMGSTKHFYDAADRLVGLERAVGPFGNDANHAGRRPVFEEYRYDALGRRILVRSRRPSSCSSAQTECSNYLERTVWDGDQVTWEIRAPGGTSATVSEMEDDDNAYSGSNGNKYGQTAYVHAGGIDQPLTVWRTGYNGSTTPIGVHPHQNWRGVYELGSKTDGTLLTYTLGTPQIDWPGYRATIDGQIARPTASTTTVWFGNLIPGKADGSGLQYMRNRYYDPATGRFTQTDPIGLAGGMNLYGFAGGDPVNFSDPFGLCPPEDTNVQDCASVQHWRDRASASGSLVGTLSNSMMAGLAAVGEDAIASVQGFAVGGCGSEFACGVAPGGRGGFRNNRVLSNFKTGRHTVSVDAEVGGSGLGQVHVHMKGAGKVLIQSIDDLSGLPNKVAKNQKVQAAITKAFEWLSKVDK